MGDLDVLIVGEVHTGLLRGRDPATRDDARRLVDLVAGEPVLVSERPVAYVRSPEKPVGVDCPLGAAGAGRQVRGVGTAVHRSAITGGHVVQGSAYAAVVRADQTARRPWSHYLARPGVIETLGRTRWPELAEALAAPRPAAGALDLGAVAGRATDAVQRAVPVAGPTRLRSSRTRLRWVAHIDDGDSGPAGVRFAVHHGELRLLRFATADLSPARLAAACEDVALHDWLLSTLIEVVRKAAIGVIGRAEALERLIPAIDYLLHLWMPGARGDEFAERVWAVLERRAGFSRQWETLVHRIRDQLSVGTVAALSAAIQR
jgi:hypothetical protein